MTDRECIWLQSVCKAGLNAKVEMLEKGDNAIPDCDQEKVDIIYKNCDKSEIDILTYNSPDYPSGLKCIFAPPYALYKKGFIPKSSAVAVIGTRNASQYGLKMAKKISSELCAAGISIISLMTGGIDSAAVEAALEEGGNIIAVSAGPLEKVNEETARAIMQSGALISEYCPGTVPNKAYFRARNRIAAGISRAVVAVEAPLKSGTFYFVEEALEQGKDIFAVPGNADSENSTGIIRLIREGAVPIVSGADLLEELGINSKPTIKKRIDKRETPNYIDITELQPNEAAIVKAVVEGCTSPDDISDHLGMSASEVLTSLTMLQIKGIIKKEAGGFKYEGK